MAVRLRLTRVGGKKDPIWRVVAADQRSPRDGRVIETSATTTRRPSRRRSCSTRSACATGSPRAPSRPRRSASCCAPGHRGLSSRLSMKELLEYLARQLVDEPDEVAVEQFEEDDGTRRARAGRGRGRLRQGDRPGRPHRQRAAHRRQGRGGQGEAPRARRHRRLSRCRRPGCRAGRVGRPHGLDGSFYVTRPRAALLAPGAALRVGDRAREIVRRAGTDDRPIVRLDAASTRARRPRRCAAGTCSCRADAPPLDEDEWWRRGSRGLRGARRRARGRRRRADARAALVRGARGRSATARGDLLVPLVRDAIRSVDIERAADRGRPGVPRGGRR